MIGRLSRARRGCELLLAVAAVCLLAACLTPAALAGSPVAGGTVTLLTDPSQSESMFLGGIAPFFVPPATLRLTDDAWRFRFPISGGNLDAATGVGSVNARGGLVLWGRETMSAWLQLSFTTLVVTTGAHPALSGLFWLSGKHRRVLATLDMSHAVTTSSRRGGHDWLTAGHVPARRSTWLKRQLTSNFPRYHTYNSRLGTVTVRARLK